MEWTSLNVCQRLLRQWDALHPYNAAHVMRLSGRPDPEALEAHWRSTLAELGLGALSTRRGQFRWTPIDGGEPRIVRRLAAGTSLDRFLSAELGARFDHDRELPFRAFVLEEAGHYWAGVVYHHWVADSVSIRVLVREWFLRTFDPAQARRVPLKIATRGYWQSFGPGRRHWSLLGGIREMGRWLGKLRTARRLSANDVRDLRTHVTVHPTPEGLIGAVASQARRRGVTVNDVFLCVLAEVCDGFVRAHGTTRGRDLALGTIVDLRARAEASRRGVRIVPWLHQRRLPGRGDRRFRPIAMCHSWAERSSKAFSGRGSQHAAHARRAGHGPASEPAPIAGVLSPASGAGRWHLQRLPESRLAGAVPSPAVAGVPARFSLRADAPSHRHSDNAWRSPELRPHLSRVGHPFGAGRGDGDDVRVAAAKLCRRLSRSLRRQCPERLTRRRLLPMIPGLISS